VQLSAIGTFADGNSYDVTNLVRWVSAVPTVATVDMLGAVKGVSAGAAAVTASFIGIASSPATLTVR
jgi:hypothetical protein